jgi:outer membrane receptor protein involved in Fe transport
VQDEWAVTGSTLVNLGVRHDGSDTDESSTNPRFALIQKFGISTTGKLLYGSAFRSPNVYEKYYVTDVGAYKQNQDLISEKINTIELVLEHYLNQDFRVGGSLFTYRIHNLISLTTDPADGLFVFRNLNDVATRGAELRAERVWEGGTRLRASYSRQEAEDEDTGQWLVNSPRHLAKLNVSTPVATGWYTGLELQYVSGRLTPFGNTVGDYTVANLTLRTDRLLKNLDVSASVYNLFDNRYADPPSEEHVDDLGRNLTAIPQNGRNYRIKLNYRF